MTRGTGQLLWQIPLTVLACVVGSLIIVWAIGSVMGFTVNPSLVAVLSAVTSAAAIASELRSKAERARSPVTE